MHTKNSLMLIHSNFLSAFSQKKKKRVCDGNSLSVNVSLLLTLFFSSNSMTASVFFLTPISLFAFRRRTVFKEKCAWNRNGNGKRGLFHRLYHWTKMESLASNAVVFMADDSHSMKKNFVKLCKSPRCLWKL